MPDLMEGAFALKLQYSLRGMRIGYQATAKASA
jgi:hypothetical protein